MDGFNWVDYIILGIFVISILVGLSRGLLREVISLLTWVAAFIIASLFSSQLAAAFTSSQPVQSVISSTSNAIGVNPATQVSWLSLGVSFIVIFIGVLIVGSIINAVFSRAADVPGISLGNRLFGAVFGLGRGFLINLVLIFLVQLVPTVQQQSWWTQSKMVVAYQPAVQWLGNIIEPGLETLKSKVGGTLQDFSTTIQNKVGSF